MLLTLLCSQLPPTLDITPANVLSALALAVALWLAFRRESREDGQTTSQRLKKVEAQLANHEQRHTGHDQALERGLDTVGRDVREVEREARRRCEVLEQSAAEVPKLREAIAVMQKDLQRLEKIEDKLDKLTEMLTGSHK